MSTEMGDLGERIAQCMNLLAYHGQLAFGAGHVSARADRADEMAIIGHLHMLDKQPGRIRREHVIRINREGEVLDGSYEPPDEYHIHTAIYAARQDVGGIAHTHPQSVIVAAAAQLPIVPLDVRSAVFSPSVPVLEFPASTHATTRERGEAVAAALGPAAAVVMQGHGAVAVGQTPEDACVVSLCLERVADMLLQLAPAVPVPFPASEVHDGVPSGLSGEELFRTAWQYFNGIVGAAP
jgi:ribulose-5-phosphate 4-epimerase/fuculose-1-phosphate aldolase